MALTITKLKMWKDPGYTRNCLEVPPAGSKKLPSVPDYSTAASETLRPHKGSTLTELHLPLSYSQVFAMSYLYIEATDGAGTVKLFGWITSIDQRSTSAEGVTIRWDVDWWRSFSGDITWGSGTITRCADSSVKRPNPTEPRRWKITQYQSIRPSNMNYDYSVVLCYNETDPNTQKTTIKYLYWQASMFSCEGATIGGVNKKTMTLSDLSKGVIDEYLDLDPDSINSIYILPYVAMQFLGYHEGSDGVHYANIGTATSGCQSFTLSQTYYSDDMKKTVIMDPDGNICYTMPWGYSTKKILVTADLGTIGGYAVGAIAYSGNPPAFADSYTDFVGAVFSIPAINMPYNSNAYSSYTYSGQREYDRASHKLQTDQKAVSGVTSGAVQGVAAGLLAMIPGVGAVLGGMTGAGAGGSLITTGINWALEEYVFNDQIRDLEDQKYANQSSQLLHSGSGFSFTQFGFVKPGAWIIAQLEGDTDSVTELGNQNSLYGYVTNHPVSSISTFIAAGGPLQVNNLNLTGTVPPEAKQYIKMKLEKGVNIVENNPSGVAP